MMSIYCCIDLKSFYASVECIERKLNPLQTNLVVADRARTEKNNMSRSNSFIKKLWNTWKSKTI